jgi:hypothetical protein
MCFEREDDIERATYFRSAFETDLLKLRRPEGSGFPTNAMRRGSRTPLRTVLSNVISPAPAKT